MDEEPIEQRDGVALEDLPGIYREGYLNAIEMARAEHDPAHDWDGFRDHLWQSLLRVFGVEVDDQWPPDLPDPVGQVSGDARQVAAWMRQELKEEATDG